MLGTRTAQGRRPNEGDDTWQSVGAGPRVRRGATRVTTTSSGGFYSNTALLRTRNAQNQNNEAQRFALLALGRV